MPSWMKALLPAGQTPASVSEALLSKMNLLRTPCLFAVHTIMAVFRSGYFGRAGAACFFFLAMLVLMGYPTPLALLNPVQVASAFVLGQLLRCVVFFMWLLP